MAQSTDDDLKKMIVKEGDVAASRQAIALAVQENKPDVLVYAVTSPSWGRKAEAVRALSKLPMHENAKAFSQILSTDTLWFHIKGGRGQAIQDDFVANLRDALSKTCGTDLSQADLFDGTVRQQIIAILATK